MDVRVGPYRRLSTEELMILSCGATEGLLRVLWTARRSNQSILKISPGRSLEGMMLKLKLQYSGHLIWRADSLEKTLMLGKIEGRRRRGRQRMRWLDGSTGSMDMSWANSRRWWRTGKPGTLQSMGSHRVGHTWEIEQQPTPSCTCFIFSDSSSWNWTSMIHPKLWSFYVENFQGALLNALTHKLKSW